MSRNVLDILKSGLSIGIGSVFVAMGFNWFLIPHHLISGGLSGVAMILGYFTPFSVSLMYFLLNIPLLVLGWFFLGRRFILYSLWAIGSTTLLLAWVPVWSVASDPLISAVFGGALAGLGAGLTYRSGGCTGGFDIIGFIITRYRDFPIGEIIIAMNGVVVLAIGYLTGDWNLTLWSALSIFLMGKVVDFLYTNHEKVTVYIISSATEQLTEALKTYPRGVTRIKAEGVYSGKEHDMLMTVTTRFDLLELRKIIKTVDASAFVNIVNTVEIMGNFRKNKL